VIWRRYWWVKLLFNMEEILVGMGMGLEELREVVRNQGAWRMLTMKVARIHRIEGTG